MGQYEKDKKELQEKIDQLEHKLKKAKQSGDKADVDKYSRKLTSRTSSPAAAAAWPWRRWGDYCSPWRSATTSTRVNT